MNNRRIASRVSAALTLAVAVALPLHAQHDTSMRSPLPRLEAICEPSGYVRNLPPSAPIESRMFRGLLIEAPVVSEDYPLRTTLFFDSGSARLDSRYNLFTDPTHTIKFDDSTIPGGTLQKYHQALNIIGYRMRKHPATTIEIVGTNSGERPSGETRAISRERAESVRNYLGNIWGIDPKRMTILPPRNLPRIPSNGSDPRGTAENRRVEILSNDYELLRPIVQSDTRRYPQPDSMAFRLHNGIPPEMIANREIEIRRGDTVWYVMRTIGIADTISPGFFWERIPGDYETIPLDNTPFTAQLVLHTKDGSERRSPVVTIPTHIVQYSIRRDGPIDSTIDRYSVFLFDFDRSRITPFIDRVIRDLILPEIAPESKILITGHTDDIGSSEHNQRLSDRRAAAYERAIRRSAIPWTQLYAMGVGEERPLYRNDFPEGRFYNRTAQFVISTPRPHPEWEW